MVSYYKLRWREIFSVFCVKDVISNCEDVSGFPLREISNPGSCFAKLSINQFLAFGTLTIGSVLTMV